MKGFIFSIKEKTDLIRTGRFSLTTQDIKYYIKRYGIHILFISMLIVGLACGTVYAMSADKEMLASLDFLFLQILTHGFHKMQLTHFVPALHLILYFCSQYFYSD